MKKQLLFVGVLSVLFLTSCMKPYQKQKFVDVKPNETAYLIPLEDGTKTAQSKLKSKDYLEKNKVVAKRIYIPTQWQKTGRWANDGYWMSSDTVIIVNRTPVTREWNSAGGGSNKTNDDAIKVESRESIGFSVCITVTASIPEDWSTLFLYSYSGKSLSQVMDNDIRGYVQNILTTQFGSRLLTLCQNERNDVFIIMKKDVTEHFAKFGIQIVNIGSSGPFAYTDPSIQNSINEKYSSEMNIQTAVNKVEAANKFAKAKASIEAQSHLDADIEIKHAIAEAIKSGNLNVPNNLTIGGGSFSILEMYGLKNMNGTVITSKSRK